jgi:ABC-type antimicrobial peptide transport system permease subunit
MKGAIARRVAQLNPSIVTQVTGLRTRVEQRLSGERIVAWLSGAFGILATALVMIGLYGIIAYLTVSRRHEIGIRLSLGATRAGIVRLVLRDSVQLLGFGLAIGLPLAVLVMRSAGALLFGLPSMHLPTAAAAAIGLAAAGLLAAAVPAWRAARVPPEIALRAE